MGESQCVSQKEMSRCLCFTLKQQSPLPNNYKQFCREALFANNQSLMEGCRSQAVADVSPSIVLSLEDPLDIRQIAYCSTNVHSSQCGHNGPVATVRLEAAF